MKADGDYGDETEAAVNKYKELSNTEGIKDEEGVGPLMLQELKEVDGFDLISASYEDAPAEEKPKEG